MEALAVEEPIEAYHFSNYNLSQGDPTQSHGFTLYPYADDSRFTSPQPLPSYTQPPTWLLHLEVQAPGQIVTFTSHLYFMFFPSFFSISEDDSWGSDPKSRLASSLIALFLHSPYPSFSNFFQIGFISVSSSPSLPYSKSTFLIWAMTSLDFLQSICT